MTDLDWFIVRDDNEVMSGPFDLGEALVKIRTYDTTEYRLIRDKKLVVGTTCSDG